MVYGELRQRCIDVVAGRPSLRCEVAAALDHPTKLVGQTLSRLVKAGLLFTRKAGRDLMYFSTRAAAEAFDTKTLAEIGTLQAKKRKGGGGWRGGKKPERVKLSPAELKAMRLQATLRAAAHKAPPLPWRNEKPAPQSFTAGPSRLKVSASAEADYSRAKLTTCPAPSYTHRYQMQPSQPSVGGFVALGIGRYVVETEDTPA